MPLKFKIGVRTPEGIQIFSVQHESINSIEQVMVLAKNELPDSKVVLVVVPK